MRSVVIEAVIRGVIEVEDDMTAEDIANYNNMNGDGEEDGCSHCAYNLFEAQQLTDIRLKQIRYVREDHGSEH